MDFSGVGPRNKLFDDNQEVHGRSSLQWRGSLGRDKRGPTPRRRSEGILDLESELTPTDTRVPFDPEPNQ